MIKAQEALMSRLTNTRQKELEAKTSSAKDKKLCEAVQSEEKQLIQVKMILKRKKTRNWNSLRKKKQTQYIEEMNRQLELLGL